MIESLLEFMRNATKISCKWAKVPKEAEIKIPQEKAQVKIRVLLDPVLHTNVIIITVLLINI
jgi:hypothetical protein